MCRLGELAVVEGTYSMISKRPSRSEIKQTIWGTRTLGDSHNMNDRTPIQQLSGGDIPFSILTGRTANNFTMRRPMESHSQATLERATSTDPGYPNYPLDVGTKSRVGDIT
ncbi:3c39028a-ed2b-4241-aeae-7794904fb7ef-CDS [Sclerotinia trifoliorum]|uniref:3c39028a-ed2b-4241-aeae-7794904fb7ef-CDS n=1 Tax=Sclerotinia trifoliorum TaxID=28548 RepID=A0A8H2VRE2_9HELO|nr:3c39028a-ed2b-4241-aeae-7794904fb7ef-CDS [Sclerotinia trifoliorum]